MSYTKGKWVFNDEDFKVRGTGDIGGMTVIANLSPKMDYSRGKNTQLANGQLIASAPDLLETLKECRDVLVMLSLIDKSNTCDKMTEKVEAAIKKAVG